VESKNFDALLGVDMCAKVECVFEKKVFCLFSPIEVIGSCVHGHETLFCIDYAKVACQGRL
jgi:hypothetical protein